MVEQTVALGGGTRRLARNEVRRFFSEGGLCEPSGFLVSFSSFGVFLVTKGIGDEENRDTSNPVQSASQSPAKRFHAKERCWEAHFIQNVHLGHPAANIPNALITILCSYLDSTEVGSVFM